jgi:hypothetical protein
MTDTPELDQHFPRLGPCLICGVAADFGVTVEAVHAALTWGDDT